MPCHPPLHYLIRQRRINQPEAEEPARGGQGFNSPPLGALRKFPIDTPSACGGVVNSNPHDQLFKNPVMQVFSIKYLLTPFGVKPNLGTRYGRKRGPNTT